MTHVARLLHGAAPGLAALIVASAAALPAHAAPATVAAPVTAAVAAGRAGAALDVDRASLWWLAALGVPAAWRAAPGAGSGVTVAVLSTGVDGTHPDLTGSVTTGPDYSQTGRNPGSPYWGAEGTAVASLIAGHGHGAGGLSGVTGIAPGARVLSVQVTLEYDDPLNSQPAITERLPDAIAAGIRYAVSHGATVIALPLDPGTLGSATAGDPAAAGGSQAERAAVAYALAHNVLLVAPAGDNGASTGTVNYPAAYPGVIAVGATTRDGDLAPFSNTDSYVALTAPGSGETPATPEPFGTSADPAAGLPVAAPGGGYQTLASTDMAAALTSGVAALIRSRYPRLTAAEVTQALEDSATRPPTQAAGWGHGALNAAAALTAAGTIAAAHPAPAPSPAAVATPHVTKRPVAAATAPASAGSFVRSFLVDLVLAACALIVILIAAMIITQVRRRKRAARTAQRHAGYDGSHARRPRTGPAALPAAPAGRPQQAGWPYDAPALAAPHVSSLAWPPPSARPRTPGDTSPTEDPQARPVRPFRLRPLAGTPPLATASRPPETPPEMLPAPPVPDGPDVPRPPWEDSPATYITAAPATDVPPWPVSTTGPMYVWNPATTGPLQGLNEDEAG